MSKIGKSQIVDALVSKTSLRKKDVEAIIKHYHDEIMAQVKAGNQVTFIGFGTFGSRDRAARTGRDPKSGKTLTIGAKTVPYFKPGAAFKELVNSKK